MRKPQLMPWFLLSLAILLSMGFVRLGFWQLSRAEQKQKMQTSLQQQYAREPENYTKEATWAQYQPVLAQGSYLNSKILLDNQFLNHRFGFRVITPFQTTEGDIILVDRGWVVAERSRKNLPTFTIPKGLITIRGQIWYPSLRTWSIGPEVEHREDGLLIIEQPSPEKVAVALGISTAPYFIRLSGSAPEGFIREWPENRMTPKRHYGYAMQWFTMATVLFGISLTLFIRKRYER